MTTQLPGNNIMRVFCCVLVTLVGLSAVPNVNSQLCLADDIQKNTEFKYKARNLYKGLTIFTANFLDAMHKANPNDNLFFSPFSLYHALLLAYFGSANQTEKGLKVRKGFDGIWLEFCGKVLSFLCCENVVWKFKICHWRNIQQFTYKFWLFA